ncbi:MAG: nicotinate-nucleotide adenylyltransferase [Fuerstiella sp.]|jgi:nicotinate-nucleotide adenylyltransferase|nr:nicotinate-nucleotide adenylyltransferase [Fuerstiella sp.]MCP4507353.1 nicotinate-nucleotide adenylyltransferase [Fuerstiella sp.]MDG2128921.1 nicotinate-nucleotide adenylyltransferase [Fuerstiella sp.]
MKLGILGGTFDPVHYGHLVLADTCRNQLSLNQVRLLPAGTPPHKAALKITDGHSRADMLQLAVSGYPEFVVDRREIKHKGPSFTVNTLTAFRNESPDAELFFLMGADSLRDLPTWKDPERILQLANVVAVNRPGLPELTHTQVIQWVGEDLARQVRTVSVPGTNISATDLRQRARDGTGLRFLVPRAVEAYIDEHGIYS